MKYAAYFFSCLTLCGAVIQEIVLHDCDPPGQASCNSYTMRNPVDDTAAALLTKVKYVCHNSNFKMYEKSGYTGASYTFLATSPTNCRPIDFEKETIGSMRFFGNPDTAKDGISLFPDINLKGVVEDFPTPGFIANVKPVSLAYSGSWTLYEGSFSGNSVCLPAAKPDNTEILNTLEKLNITTWTNGIKSGFKGCEPVTAKMRDELRRQFSVQ